MACDRTSIRPVVASLAFGLTIGLITCVLLAADAGPRAAEPESVLLSVELPDRPTAGARLFAQKSCVRCHSLLGREGQVGPDLGRLLFSGTVLELAGSLWNHAPIMREKMQDLRIQQPQMTTAEMADLVALLTAYRYYLTELGQPGNAEAGRKIFTVKGCGRCHDDDSRTAWHRPGPSLERYQGRFSGIFLAQAMWNHGGEMATVMRGSGVPWPRFEGRDMGDLLAYLHAGNAGRTQDHLYFEPGSPRRGRTLFGEKGCGTCHAVAGVGGRGGPDLGLLAGDLVRPVPEIAGLMWNHSLGMTAEFQRRRLPRVTFSGQEMADIIAYLYFVNFANVRGVPDRGARLFDQKCSACHARGVEQRMGPDLMTAPGLDDPFAIIAAMWNHAPRMEHELQARGLPWPRFERGQAADLAAHLLSRRGAVAVRRQR
ncbi:MAG: cytochrome c [Acidobacteria bacterium]|nr:cytochrome c [Acidobacteriota bacterium]